MKQDNNNIPDISRFHDIQIPDRLPDVVQMGILEGKRLCRKKNNRNNIIKLASAAAVVFILCTVLLSNPVLAAKIPLVGHIFEKLQDDFSYTGDFSSVATPLNMKETSKDTTETGVGEESNQSPYSKTVDGTTVTLSEIYCNDQAVYITLTIQGKDKIPATFIDINGNPIILLSTVEKYSFNKDTIQNRRHLEGKFIDEYTYAGICRIDLSEVVYDASAYKEAFDKLVQEGAKAEELTDDDIDAKVVKVDIPEEFTLNFEITKIVGDLADTTALQTKLDGFTTDKERMDFISGLPYPNKYENHWYTGPWNYDLDVKVDRSRTQIIEVNTTNEDGIGISTIERTPYELKMNQIYPSDESNFNHFAVALDADGDILPYGGYGGLTNIYALQNRDISTIDIYICDYSEYMDELKGYYWSEDYQEKKKEKTFKQLLDERAVYHTQIHLPNEK